VAPVRTLGVIAGGVVAGLLTLPLQEASRDWLPVAALWAAVGLWVLLVGAWVAEAVCDLRTDQRRLREWTAVGLVATVVACLAWVVGLASHVKPATPPPKVVAAAPSASPRGDRYPRAPYRGWILTKEKPEGRVWVRNCPQMSDRDDRCDECSNPAKGRESGLIAAAPVLVLGTREGKQPELGRDAENGGNNRWYEIAVAADSAQGRQVVRGWVHSRYCALDLPEWGEGRELPPGAGSWLLAAPRPGRGRPPALARLRGEG